MPALIGAVYRVVTYDRRGFGDSSQPWTGYDYDTFAADLDVLLSHLELRDVALVGFSTGGGEVARYIGRYGSERVAKVVLAAVPPYLYKSDDNPEGGLDDETIQQFQDGVRDDRIAFLDRFTTDFFAAGDRTALISEPSRLHHRDIASFASPKGTLDCMTAFGCTDFRRDDQFKIDAPTLVLHGDSEAIVPLEVSGKRSHEAIVGSSLVLIEGGPHGLNATYPKELNRALLDFLG